MGIGAGPAIYEIRKKIKKLESELDSIASFEVAPEMIESANLLRSNEYLEKKLKKQDDLLQAYRAHSDGLEEMLQAVFDIQSDLKDILKEQSTLLSKKKSKKRTKSSRTNLKRG
ncbi:MAG: hypothetical protein OXC46_03360 [Thaumarchaeota archaeon]|nr:hypothetical protein [Nitrososphaerota archaeon]